MKAISLALVGALAFTACAKNKAGGSEQSRAADMSAPAPPAAGAATTPANGKAIEKKPVDTRKVIRTGRVELTVENYDAARAKLDAAVAAAGGYIDSTQVDRHKVGVSTAVIVIRIPADNFGSVIPSLGQIGDVTNESTSASDITDQYVDTAAQLASAQVLEKRLLELAASHDGTLDHVLTVERELTRVRAEIEGHQGHLNQWNDQVSMSTLTITMSTRPAEVAAVTIPPPASLGSKTAQSFYSSIGALRDLASWILINGVALLPWLLFLVPAGLGIQRLARRHLRSIPVAIVNPPSE
jgi:hypothetical protein